ncbi:hypothetical protein T4B_11068 [Trichinella pseudospiralis]|uniref:Uncharacterized protein n=1 Tax=Trichinella pseudospiralis TaxID=6337 RepID=A0A0V1GIX5_TRIPS|nr:hypothetical protein T4B_11068 [Trichinella pseudospiralis]
MKVSRGLLVAQNPRYLEKTGRIAIYSNQKTSKL